MKSQTPWNFLSGRCNGAFFNPRENWRHISARRGKGNTMAHEISEQQLLADVEGAADGSLRRRIQAHLVACSECAERHEQLRTWHQRLAGEGARIRAAMALEGDALE